MIIYYALCCSVNVTQQVVHKRQEEKLSAANFDRLHRDIWGYQSLVCLSMLLNLVRFNPISYCDRNFFHSTRLKWGAEPGRGNELGVGSGTGEVG